MTTYKHPELAQIQVHGMSRASFIMRGALATGAVYGLGSVTPFVNQALAQEEDGDVGIMNFALTLEFLENAYYEQGLKQVSGLSADTKKLATEIRDNEAEHVSLLQDAIQGAGGKPTKAPEVDFGMAFGSEQAFLELAQTFEDTGVSAYNGAGPAIMSTDVLAAAGSIVQIEARHAALIRLANSANPAPEAFDKTMSTDEVLQAVMPFVKS